MTHQDKVLLHMIGQTHAGGAGRYVVSVRDVARWMKCTPQNANQKLRQLMDMGFVLRKEAVHRKNAVKHYYCLSGDCYKMYQRGEFQHHYIAWIHDQPIPF